MFQAPARMYVSTEILLPDTMAHCSSFVGSCGETCPRRSQAETSIVGEGWRRDGGRGSRRNGTNGGGIRSSFITNLVPVARTTERQWAGRTRPYTHGPHHDTIARELRVHPRSLRYPRQTDFAHSVRVSRIRYRIVFRKLNRLTGYWTIALEERILFGVSYEA